MSSNHCFSWNPHHFFCMKVEAVPELKYVFLRLTMSNVLLFLSRLPGAFVGFTRVSPRSFFCNVCWWSGSLWIFFQKCNVRRRLETTLLFTGLQCDHFVGQHHDCHRVRGSRHWLAWGERGERQFRKPHNCKPTVKSVYVRGKMASAFSKQNRREISSKTRCSAENYSDATFLLSTWVSHIYHYNLLSINTPQMPVFTDFKVTVKNF